MELNELFTLRRSVRAYDETKAVSREDVEQILEEARMAPSWKNSQTARVYAAVSTDKLQQVMACLPGFNQNSAAGCGALLVTAYVKDTAGFTAGKADNEPGNEWGAYDLGLYTSYLCLAARNHGMDTLIMGLRDADALRDILNIPENEQIMAVLSLGFRKGEPVLRPRKSAGEYITIV